MPVVCPKCGHTRQPNETAPDWQCPACGVCYAKVREAAQGAAPPERAVRVVTSSHSSGIPWGKLILIAALAWGGWTGVKVFKNRGIEAGFGAEVSAAELSALAATVTAGEVTMYSTTECGYCTQAKNWLDENGFAFKECNMSVDRSCEREFMSYHANGTPFLIVRGHQMHDGFNSNEFISLLKK